ncbi:MAG: PaaI family thioesterase [Solirubrobacterales bacterium]|mgnify:CR=1 FL=1
MHDEGPAMPATTLDTTLGFRDYSFDGEGRAEASLPVTDAIRQPYGIVHGGAYAALAESLCSRATYEAVGPENLALGQANDTSFLRPCSEGTVRAVATARHRGRTSWVWDVEMRDDEDRLLALTRMTIAVRPMPAPRT